MLTNDQTIEQPGGWAGCVWVVGGCALSGCPGHTGWADGSDPSGRGHPGSSCWVGVPCFWWWYGPPWRGWPFGPAWPRSVGLPRPAQRGV